MHNPHPTRYQAAILNGGDILLIQHCEHASGRAYWVLPGGGIEPGEGEAECVRREAWEETSLEVRVEHLLLDDSIKYPFSPYLRYKTYLCHPVAGDPSPGYEPEPEASARYAIAQVGWFHLWDETTWGEAILRDPITPVMLRRVRAALEAQPS